jgi:type IX secretion system PorP/SprF family membrane protein
MMQATKKILTVVAAVLATLTTTAQNELIISQYIHNRYAVNPSFAGVRNGLSIFGSFRKQWAGIENTPQSILLTAHAPLKHDNLVLGLQAYSQHIHQSTNTGLMTAVGYRVSTGKHKWLSFALQPGVSLHKTNWADVRLMDEASDDVFSENETSVAPLLGVGASWYGLKYFVGFSVQSLLVSDDFDQRDAKFAPGDAVYVATGGMLFDMTDKFGLQPSMLMRFKKGEKSHLDATLSGIYNDFIWVSAGYRTDGDAVFGVAAQVAKRFRVAYHYEFTTGDLNGYNNGSHEISLQYDFIYKVKVVGPKFF